jgi:hypothetical protein
VRLPEATENTITWESDALSCTGHWERKGQSLSKQELYKGNDGVVQWDVLFPLSEVHIERFGAATNHQGFGYVETLELTIPPWRLPLNELIWGRFVSPELSLVWVKWSGSHPIELVFCNGSKVEKPSVSTDEVHWQTGTLKHINARTLREGPIIKTALKKIPGITSVFPRQILNLHETKWLSASEVIIHGKKYYGWSIHELVKF